MATGTYTTHIELDLNAACPLGPNSIADRINDVVPGLKTSTGKLRIYISTHPTFFHHYLRVGAVPCMRGRAEMGMQAIRELHNLSWRIGEGKGNHRQHWSSRTREEICCSLIAFSPSLGASAAALKSSMTSSLSPSVFVRAS